MTLNAIPDLPASLHPSLAATQPVAAPVPPPAPAPEFLTARQLAAKLGVSRRTLTTWNQRGIIPSVCGGRVRRYELEAVKAALRARPSSTTPGSPGMGLTTGTAADFEYHFLP